MEPKLSKEEKQELQWREKLKTTIEAEQGRVITDKELDQCASFLKTLAKIQVSIFLEDQRRKEKLETFPEGYVFDKKGYSCRLCQGSASMEKGWYDKYGLQCLDCHHAIMQGIVPGEIVENDDLYYTEFGLESSLNVPVKIQRQWVKAGILKCRDIPRQNTRRTHLRIYLVADNAGFIPEPSQLPQGGHVKEMEDGKEYIVSRPWWEFVEARNVLKDYGISRYITTEPTE